MNTRKFYKGFSAEVRRDLGNRASAVNRAHLIEKALKSMVRVIEGKFTDQNIFTHVNHLKSKLAGQTDDFEDDMGFL